jgi:O-acetyl-ADP-ribose deacetylase (regulator of RNase III)/DNA-binding transcriptional ArsR family regulator
VSNIPTVRSLYRSRRLLQRDQSYAPNDTYNQVISFCYHDLTLLKVDAIVNSANKAMRDTGGKTLNNMIHRAAGRELGKETKAKGKIQDKAILTGGYDLAAKHIIHVLRPGYYNSKGMTEFNQLIDCYRNALNIAADHQLKTIAFPCLGTGGLGFPPRVAACITLQEVREYLDVLKDYEFERIIFCVNTAADEKAYMDFLPVYFPPTHDDVETARSSVWSEDRAAIAVQILDTRNAVQKVFSQLQTSFSLSVPNFPEDLLLHLDVIDTALASIRRFLLWSNELNKSMRDLKLVCTVLHLFSGNITETIELAKDHASLGQHSDKSIWDDYVSDMETRHATNPSAFLKKCRDFLEGLDSMITRNGVDVDEVIEMVDMRQQLERYKVRQRGGGDSGGAQDHLNEILHVREFQRQTIAQSRDTVKLFQIQSVFQLYELGELEEIATLAQPSALFNDSICLVREDITKLEVDVMVNSTDTTFGGMGTLDRSVFLKGGVELRNAIEAFKNCKEGDVKLTEGYLLPAKHVLHVVPPNQYRKDTKDMLRKIYRELLHTAVAMRATSIAIPSIGKYSYIDIRPIYTDWIIGTGMLFYPRRECVSLALEETKRFLESAVPNSMLQKIVFVVYSSHDEFVYTRLLPVYFPPIKPNVRPASVMRQDTGASTSSTMSAAPRRTLFGSIGEAFRSVRSGKTSSETSRPITANEEHALISFESHARDCETCLDIDKLYTEGRDLCEHGYSAAQIVLWNMNMQSDLNVYSKPDATRESVRLEIPMDMFPISLSLLATVEKSHQHGDRSRPFVSTNRPYGAIVRDQRLDTVPSGAIPNADVETPIEPEPKLARAHVLTKSALTEQWNAVAASECQIRVYPDKVDIIVENDKMPVGLVSCVLDHATVVKRHMTTPEVLLTGARSPKVTLKMDDEVLFRCRSDSECNSLLRMIRRAIEGLQDTAGIENQHKGPKPLAEFIQGSSDDYLQWNKRLQDVRSELASAKRASGGLSDLQFKMLRLSGAASDLHEAQPSFSSSKRLFDPSRSPLATRVLVCLTADLKSRPGSYIGMKTDDIVTELRTTPEEALSVLNELMAEGEVHQTVDENTWVITHPPSDLPVLSLEQTGTNTREFGTVDELQSQPTQDSGSNDMSASIETQHDPRKEETQASAPLEQAKPTNTSEGDSILDRVHRYIRHSGYVPSEGPLYDLHAALSLTETEVSHALAVLKKLDLVQSFEQDGKWWYVAKDKQEIKQTEKDQSQDTETSSTPIIRNTPSFKDTPPSPTLPPSTSTPHLSLNTININDFFSYTSPSGPRWTRIDKRLVDPRVLAVEDEDFEDVGDALVVHRVLRREEIRRWAEESVVLREGRARYGGDREGGVKGKGKGREKEARDEYQEKLDRVIAGDIREEELRHFGDGKDDERYI